jgi:hypothetical protein
LVDFEWTSVDFGALGRDDFLDGEQEGSMQMSSAGRSLDRANKSFARIDESIISQSAASITN